MPTRRLQVQISLYEADLERLDRLVTRMNEYGWGSRPNRSATIAALLKEKHEAEFPTIPAKRSRVKSPLQGKR
jgi:hypothetical protein